MERMVAEIADVWKESLPQVLNGVTGRGVWAALNAARPVTMEEGVFVLGVPMGTGDLAGHLRVHATQRLIETTVASKMGQPVKVRIIDGIDLDDWNMVKRRDAERRRLQDAEMAKMRAELEAKTSWDTVYESLARRYAAIANKSLPQNRARFYEEAIEVVADARKAIAAFDEQQERNFARCLERVTQYTEVPSTLVARDVLKATGEL